MLAEKKSSADAEAGATHIRKPELPGQLKEKGMTSGQRQEQFLTVLDPDEARRRFEAVLRPAPLRVEVVPLSEAHGRILAEDVVAPTDLPPFDRSNVDGYAVRAEDTYGASEESPRRLRVNPETIVPGMAPQCPVAPGTASVIATGAMLPRGADAVVMIEHTDVDRDVVLVLRPVAPGANVTYAGSDVGRGETVLRRGDCLTARETAVLAALGAASVPVWKAPRVAIISTGDELRKPGTPLPLGCIYDSNATMLADAVREQGGKPVLMGIVPDDLGALRRRLQEALAYDVVLLSGGTSKGAGDLSYRAVAELPPPGIVAHGIALKPGKPLCLAATQVPGTDRVVPVVVLPGFPSSALFTFYEFVAPVVRRMVGRTEEGRPRVPARLAVRLHSDRGRTEYVLVALVKDPQGLVAYPIGKGSGSVTAFSRADGFITVPKHQELLEADETVHVQLLGASVQAPDLLAIGSHCVGFDMILSELNSRHVRCRAFWVGSLAGLEAARRGECDVAGMHLYDPETDTYNVGYLSPGLVLIRGYRRLQGIVYRRGDPRVEGKSLEELRRYVSTAPDVRMVNRNRGSGTRVLLDRFLQGARPDGYNVELRTHNAVVAAVLQGRADWGVAIEVVARHPELGFVPLQHEHYDFVIPESRLEQPAVQAFRSLLREETVRRQLAAFGFDTEGLGQLVYPPVAAKAH
jgi:putative molybdopterin biosynthesis protein